MEPKWSTRMWAPEAVGPGEWRLQGSSHVWWRLLHCSPGAVLRPGRPQSSHSPLSKSGMSPPRSHPPSALKSCLCTRLAPSQTPDPLPVFSTVRMEKTTEQKARQAKAHPRAAAISTPTLQAQQENEATHCNSWAWSSSGDREGKMNFLPPRTLRVRVLEEIRLQAVHVRLCELETWERDNVEHGVIGIFHSAVPYFFGFSCSITIRKWRIYKKKLLDKVLWFALL